MSGDDGFLSRWSKRKKAVAEADAAEEADELVWLVEADAAAVLHQGMYRSLAQGVPVPEAVAGGRRALRAHASAAPAGGT